MATMATDEAPRTQAEHMGGTFQGDLKTRRSDRTVALVDEGEIGLAAAYDLPGADLSGEELTVQIVAAQADEFTCSSCFLVRHRSQIAREKDGRFYCQDCEG